MEISQKCIAFFLTLFKTEYIQYNLTLSWWFVIVKVISYTKLYNMSV